MLRIQPIDKMAQKLADIIREGWDYRLAKLNEILPSFVVEFIGFGAIESIEGVRADYVNPKSDLIIVMARERLKQGMDPILDRNQNPGLYKFLQHGGDLFEGYFYSFLINNFLTYALPRMPEKYRLSAALLIANGIIAAKEIGIIEGQKPDYCDIPAGVAGSVIYLGINYLGRLLTRKLSTNQR